MSDANKRAYQTAGDALHVKRSERMNAEMRHANATNEAGRTAAVSAALEALPASATYLDVQRAIWRAAAEHALARLDDIGDELAIALDAELHAGERVNEIVARILGEPPPSG